MRLLRLFRSSFFLIIADSYDILIMQPIVDKYLKEMLYMSIGERICTLRKERNISQAQLAKILDVSRQAVSKWENDSSAPDTVKLIQLADVLDTEVAYLATGVMPVYESPPIVVNMVEKVDQIKVVEKMVEKPVIRRVERVKYVRNPVEFLLLGVGCFIVGLILGLVF